MMSDDPFAREFEAIAGLVDSCRRPLILGHVDPDGDCIGSMLALARYLGGLGREAVCYAPGEMADLYRELPLSRLFVSEERLASLHPDLVFALDSPTLARTADPIRWGAGVSVVNIDHHPTNERYGDINVIEESASATAILVYRFLSCVAPTAITPETANYLYIGVLMDTGGFRFRNTNAEALEAAARFAALGASPHQLAHDFLYVKKLSTLKLLSLALGSLEVHAGGRIGLMHVSQRMLEEAGGVMSDTEGFVDFPASIDDVELAALFRELGPAEVRVSLRSRNDFDVASLAERHGGGGHRNAAGLTIHEGLETAKRLIRVSLQEMLDGGHGGGAA